MRGATLELLDITYDGEEDSVTGVLSGGLGQLVIIIIIIIFVIIITIVIVFIIINIIVLSTKMWVCSDM